MNPRDLLFILVVMIASSSFLFRCGKSKKDSNKSQTPSVTGTVNSGKF